MDSCEPTSNCMPSISRSLRVMGSKSSAPLSRGTDRVA